MRLRFYTSFGRLLTATQNSDLACGLIAGLAWWSVVGVVVFLATRGL